MNSFLKTSLLQIKNGLKIVQNYSTLPSNSKTLVCLYNRSIVQLAGNGVFNFLQGLITNDIRHLQNGAANIYTLLLNKQGRVLYDAIIYKTENENVIFIECDNSIIDDIIKHMQMYDLRKKISIKSLQEEMKVWVLFDENLSSFQSNKRVCKDEDSLSEEKLLPCGIHDNKSFKSINNNFIYADPRLNELGNRILTSSTVSDFEISKNIEANSSFKESSKYKIFRYKLGIGEGVEDLVPKTMFPLEINCDFLNGISFNKGCYIGQELTARTRYTGVIRKRLMPLTYNETKKVLFKYDDKIMNESSKVVGKIKGAENGFLLGLMRVNETLNSKTLKVGDYEIKINYPFWWPKELQTNEKLINRR